MGSGWRERMAIQVCDCGKKILGNTFNISHCFCSIDEFSHDIKLERDYVVQLPITIKQLESYNVQLLTSGF